MTPRARRVLRYGLGIPAGLLLTALLAAWLALRASLPRLDGEIAVGGLSANVAIERDAAGVPVIRGATERMSRARPAMRTRRTAGSRWIC